jgi:hypothetical protein
LGPGVAIDAKDGAKPAFSSFWYAVDTIVPFLDFEESKAWEPVATHNETKCKAWPDGINLQWRPILAVLGLMLTTITAAALGTRAESAFRRVEE